MSRKKKLMFNVTIISILLYVFYYFGGLYVSKEQCIVETMRGLYVKGNEIFIEVRSGNEIKTLVGDTTEGVVSMIGTKQFGFLYRTSDCFTNQTLKKDQAFNIIAGYNSDAGQTIFVFRNNKDIAYIELKLNNGTNVVFDEWSSDFAGTILDTNDWVSGVYKAYSSNGELLEVMEY